MMGGRTAGGGSREKPMAEGSAQDHRVRESMQGPGATALKSWACTRGQAATATREPGRRASGMASELKARAAGSTEGSGRRGSKAAMDNWRARPAAHAMRGRGAMVCRMDTALKPTLTEVRLIICNRSATLPSEFLPISFFRPNISLESLTFFFSMQVEQLSLLLKWHIPNEGYINNMWVTSTHMETGVWRQTDRSPSQWPTDLYYYMLRKQQCVHYHKWSQAHTDV